MDPETEPILDHGKDKATDIEEGVIAEHKNIYVGMHLASPHQKRRPKSGISRKSWMVSDVDVSDKTVYSPSQKVQFILGNEMEQKFERIEADAACPQIFTEMDELHQNEDGDMLWKETARWIKFEEVVEDSGNRWSKPHVATLSLHSLFELRASILKGVVMLDMEASDIGEIADQVIDQMIVQEQLPKEDDIKSKVKTALISNHKHVTEKKRGTSLKKNSSSSGGLPSNQSKASLKGKSQVPYFMKKIPAGAEASNVLVGEVDFLENKVIALVRLRQSALLEQLTEVPIPTRFLFILLGPSGSYPGQYHEVGRSIATLMSDEVFHEVAYKARNRKDILAGIDEFLEQVTVLPPGEWDASIRIEPPLNIPKDQKKRLESVGPRRSSEEPHSHGISPELQRTGRLFGGLINDIKRKQPFYLSDFKDALSLQCLASFIFLYFAILTPIVTFGGLLSDATDKNLGTMESILAGAISGCTYHMFSGQPLTIIGSTGPILVFEKIMFELCTSAGLQYISFRWWVGTWTGVACLILVATDASSLISYVTRFTEESFSALISLIFIYEAFKKLIYDGNKHPIWFGWMQDNITQYGCDCLPPTINGDSLQAAGLNSTQMKNMVKELNEGKKHVHHGTLFAINDTAYHCVFENDMHNVSDVNSLDFAAMGKEECIATNCGHLVGESCGYFPDAALMSVVLFFGTFTIAMFLKGLKTSRFFPAKVRSIISDFAVTIGIIVMVGVDMAMKLDTTKLYVPDTFRPTREDRTWFISPLGKNPWWTIPAAIVPALLATILIFMDQQITAVIVNRKENKLKKGAGYHLDLLIVAIMLILCSVMGLPWFVAATVLSITHVQSLTMESESAAPGDRPKFLGIREQRVTGVLIFLMIGVSIKLTPILAYIPMPVLYGVFLYMGVSSLRGVQLVDRMMLFFMPPKYQPDHVYLRHVKLSKVYLFTIIQVTGLALLWLLKSLPTVSIVFPLMVAALVGIRRLMDLPCINLFTQHDLMWLDDILPEPTRKKKEDGEESDDDDAANDADGLHNVENGTQLTKRNTTGAVPLIQVESSVFDS